MSFQTSTGKIIKDQEKLSFDYVPEELPNREDQIQNLFGLFRGIVSSNISQNVLLYGPVGTGKTATAKRFCMDFEDWAKEKGKTIDYAFVNCRRRKKDSSVMWKVVHHFDKGFPDRGFSTEEMMEVIKGKIEERNLHLIIVLDEVDYLIQKSGSDLIYLLSRFDEERLTPKGNVSLLLVSQKNAFQLLEESARSSFKRSNRVKFPKYTNDELFPILQQRVDIALYSGSIDEEKIRLLSDISGKGGDGGGDARFGIELLEKTCLIAEMDGRNEVSSEDVRAAKAEVNPHITESKLRDLKDQEKLVLLAATRALKNTTYTTTGDIEEIYKVVCEEKDNKKLGHTQFWNYLQSLSDQGILNTRTFADGSGRTTKVSLSDITAEKLEKKIESLI